MSDADKQLSTVVTFLALMPGGLAFYADGCLYIAKTLRNCHRQGALRR
jgi:hypothetical protein